MRSVRVRRARLVLAGAAVLAVGVACSGGDDGGLGDEAQALADAFAADFADGDGGFGVDADQGACMGEAILLELGTEPFEAAGVTAAVLEETAATPGSLLGSGAVTDAEAAAIADRWRLCVDFEAAYAASKADAFGLREPAEVACLAEGMRGAGFLDELVRLSFTQAEPEPASNPVRALVGLADGCGSGDGALLVEQLADLFVARGSLDETQAPCVARRVIDEVGVDRFLEITAGTGTFDGAPPEVQQELTRAVLAATAACGIPLEQQAGG